jgi:hypothetical protein
MTITCDVGVRADHGISRPRVNVVNNLSLHYEAMLKLDIDDEKRSDV